MTIKFVDAYGDNENIDVGQIGVIGTLNMDEQFPENVEMEDIFVVKKQLVNTLDDSDSDAIEWVNSNLCVCLYETET